MTHHQWMNQKRRLGKSSYLLSKVYGFASSAGVLAFFVIIFKIIESTPRVCYFSCPAGSIASFIFWGYFFAGFFASFFAPLLVGKLLLAGHHSRDWVDSYCLGFIISALLLVIPFFLVLSMIALPIY